ncbi:transporter [Apiospora arundinis]|uniref:Transporter n=1 Tax=Apiospora arundinis TaxID=335852 RepID=A0ABR2JGM9_9PEZI
MPNQRDNVSPSSADVSADADIIEKRQDDPGLEAVMSGGSEEKIPVAADGYYHNFAPIAGLNLPDWRATEKKLVRRLDMTLLPTVWILYLNNYLDRTNIAQARLNTFEEDLGLSGDDYNTAVAVLTVGYMLAQLPSNMLLTRVRPSVYLPVTAIVWSAVSAATAGTTSPETLFVVRFFLGILEAPLFPGSVYVMSCWYTRREIALRTAILYSGLVLAQAFSGILAAAIFGGLDGAAGIAGWKWLFIIESLMSTVCGVAAFWTLPDYPHSKTGSQRWALDGDMRRLAEARMVADRVTGASGTGTVWTGVKLAVTDFKTWIFVLLNIFMTGSYGFNFFFPTLVRGLGIGNNTTSLLLTAPPYFLGAIVSFFASWNSDRIRERGFHISAGLLAAAIGYIITIATTNMAARYAASFLFAPGSFSANALVYTWAVSTLSTTPEKRAAAGAIVNIFGHLGNVISPYFFRDEEKPAYRLAFILMLVFGGTAFAIASGAKIYLKLANRRLKKRAAETGEVYNPFIS